MSSDALVHHSARIHPTALVEPGASVGARTAIWDAVHVRAGARIGASCILGEKTYVAYDVVVGDLVKINAAVYLPAGTRIGDGVMIAAHVVFTNDRFPRAADPDLTVALGSEPNDDTRPSRVERGASIGANATIGPGLVIGEYAMVGMGSVVTHDVPPHALVVGNPARLAGLVARDGRVVWRAQGAQELPEGASFPCPGDGVLVVRGGRAHHVPRGVG